MCLYIHHVDLDLYIDLARNSYKKIKSEISRDSDQNDPSGSQVVMNWIESQESGNEILHHDQRSSLPALLFHFFTFRSSSALFQGRSSVTCQKGAYVCNLPTGCPFRYLCLRPVPTPRIDVRLGSSQVRERCSGHCNGKSKRGWLRGNNQTFHQRPLKARIFAPLPW